MMIHALWRTLARTVSAFVLAAAIAWPGAAARAAEPIKIGFSMALTGAVAVAGKQILAALEIWRDDVNAGGGLMGRPIEFVYYDDQSTPSLVPGILTKLIDVDHVDLLIGPYATNLVAPAIPVVMQHNMTTIGLFANAANSKFHYQRYFSILPTGPEPQRAFSTGLFELALAQKPKPETVAILAANAEFAQNAADGARENAKTMGFRIIYDQSYPPNTTDYGSVVRAVQAVNADIVYVAAYPPDTVGIVRAAAENNLDAKIFGGTFIGLLSTPIKIQLGPLANGIINNEVFPEAPSFNFPGMAEVMKKYQAKAPSLGIDPMGYAYVPLTYAAGQVLAQAVKETGGLDQNKIADYIRAHSFKTVAGDIAFGKDGEWAKSRTTFIQFQHVTGNTLDEFRGGAHAPILWPAEYKTGNIIYPYGKAKK